jgi:hypothetical protein
LSLLFYLFFGLVGLLVLLFAWVLRSAKGRSTTPSGQDALGDCGRRHVTCLPQIRQALAKTDYEFLASKTSSIVLRRVRRERRRVALAYLAALRGDFQSLLRMARVIALLSPEVAAVQEFERLKLTLAFSWHFELIRLQLWVGLAPMPQLDGLSHLVSGLSVRMERAMMELGERAALAAELFSSLDRGGVDPAR